MLVLVDMAWLVIVYGVQNFSGVFWVLVMCCHHMLSLGCLFLLPHFFPCWVSLFPGLGYIHGTLSICSCSGVEVVLSLKSGNYLTFENHHDIQIKSPNAKIQKMIYFKIWLACRILSPFIYTSNNYLPPPPP